VKLKLTNKSELQSLMDAAAYQAFIASTNKEATA
jgi:glycine cleavage system H lipoate-binding protein